MSDNRSAKQKLIKICGPRCFIEALGIRSPQEVNRELQRYKSKGVREQLTALTYHHIKERFMGGKATFNNGALLKNINHRWFNRLSLRQQAELNKLFTAYRESQLKAFKLAAFNISVEDSSLVVQEAQEVCFNQDDYLIIPVESNIISIDDRNSKFNRSAERQCVRTQISESLLEYNDR